MYVCVWCTCPGGGGGGGVKQVYITESCPITVACLPGGGGGVSGVKLNYLFSGHMYKSSPGVFFLNTIPGIIIIPGGAG